MAPYRTETQQILDAEQRNLRDPYLKARIRNADQGRALGATPFVLGSTRKVRGMNQAEANAMLKRERSAGYDPRNSYDAAFARDHVWAKTKREPHAEAKRVLAALLGTACMLAIGDEVFP